MFSRVWRQVDEVLDELLDLPEEERPNYLEAACGDDVYVREALEKLLAADATMREVVDAVASRCVPLLDYRPGDRLSCYRLGKILERTGNAIAFRAEGVGLASEDGPLILKLGQKVLSAAQLRRRFRVHHRVLTRLEHPNIERVVDAGVSDDSRPYVVVERVEGTAILRYCDRDRLGIRQRLELFAEFCATVGFAHCLDLVHRDLRPDNLVVTPDGEVRVLDFGSAALMAPPGDSSSDSSLTPLKLTNPYYTSPEQLNEEPLTPASDVYTLGVVLFELLTGFGPYRLDGPLPLTIVRAVCWEEAGLMSEAVLHPRSAASPTRWDDTDPEEASHRRGYNFPRALARRLAGDLDNIVARALAKDPEQRYASAAELGHDVERCLRDMPVEASSWRSRARRAWHRVLAPLRRADRLRLLESPFRALTATF